MLSTDGRRRVNGRLNFSTIFSLLPAHADVSATDFCLISFQTLNFELVYFIPPLYYIGFDLLQFRPSIKIDYIL